MDFIACFNIDLGDLPSFAPQHAATPRGCACGVALQAKAAVAPAARGHLLLPTTTTINTTTLTTIPPFPRHAACGRAGARLPGGVTIVVTGDRGHAASRCSREVRWRRRWGDRAGMKGREGSTRRADRVSCRGGLPGGCAQYPAGPIRLLFQDRFRTSRREGGLGGSGENGGLTPVAPLPGSLLCSVPSPCYLSLTLPPLPSYSFFYHSPPSPLSD